MKRLIRYIREKIALRRERKALMREIKRSNDALKFLSTIKRVADGTTGNYFLSNASIMFNGFVSANVPMSTAIGGIIAEEIAKLPRPHRVDVSSPVVDGIHKDGDFLLQIRFRELSGT